MRYLVRMIDDATSWSWGRFVDRDSTPHNMGVLWEYLEKNGRMVDVYTDPDSMFTVPLGPEESDEKRRQADRLTQLGRALRELGIGSILAYSPQAKGRIERSFLTAQDRPVKHLRLAKVTILEGANAFLEQEYWPEWNAHFARPVADFPNHHRALTPQLELPAILCHMEERVIGNDYTFSFAGRHYQIQRAAVQAGMRRQRVRVELRLDGELKARYEGRYVEIGECGARPMAAEAKPAGTQRSQRRRQEPLDGWLLQSPQSAAMEVPGEVRKSKPNLEDALFLCPKPQLRDSTKAMDPGRAEPSWRSGKITGSASQEGSRRLLRSQPRRLGFGQPRQARPRRGCANIPWRPQPGPQNRNFLLGWE